MTDRRQTTTNKPSNCYKQEPAIMTNSQTRNRDWLHLITRQVRKRVRITPWQPGLSILHEICVSKSSTKMVPFEGGNARTSHGLGLPPLSNRSRNSLASIEIFRSESRHHRWILFMANAMTHLTFDHCCIGNGSDGSPGQMPKQTRVNGISPSHAFNFLKTWE